MEGQAVVDLDHEQHYNGGRGTLARLLEGEHARRRWGHLRAADGTWTMDIVDQVGGTGRGIYDDTDPRNPFGDWYHVFIPYCTGDLHWGDAVATYGSGGAAVTIDRLLGLVKLGTTPSAVAEKPVSANRAMLGRMPSVSPRAW